jgi:hypothetical protein
MGRLLGYSIGAEGDFGDEPEGAGSTFLRTDLQVVASPRIHECISLKQRPRQGVSYRETQLPGEAAKLF